ncbi:MAG: universal stress protein [Dehalococcoidales bacterium]|nr:universal stress protein [Dehalococcoidales bacterium]
MYKKVIVPLDGSKLAECVLPHVESIAGGCSAEEVVLITVTERAAGLMPKVDHTEQPGSYEVHQPAIAFADRPYSGRRFELDASLGIPVVTGKMLRQGQSYLGRIAEQLGEKGIRVSIAVLMGEAAEQIVDFAGKEKADLIVMASHGRSGFSRWAMGSVAEKVFHGSNVPVLLVKAAFRETTEK